MFILFEIFLVEFLFIEFQHANDTELLELFQIVKPITQYLENSIRLDEVRLKSNYHSISQIVVSEQEYLLFLATDIYWLDALGEDKVIAAKKPISQATSTISRMKHYFFRGI